MKKIVLLFSIGLLLFSCRPPENPYVSTGEVTNISSTTATCTGNVTADGGATIIARGFCWSTSQFPTISDSKTSCGTGLGVFTDNITGLTPITTYYVTAYATNSVGTTYGEQKTFTTKPEMPTVVTGEVTDITDKTATFTGNVTADGGAPIIARGICWSTSQNPTTSNSKTTRGTGLGTYSSNITGLSPNTTYYVKAYASNSQGTAYGEQRTFKTQQEQDPVFGSFTDSRDGNQYKTVTIGLQVWMAENLAYLPWVSADSTSATLKHYYVYGYYGTDVAEAKRYEYEYFHPDGHFPIKTYETYGVLYNWPAAMNGAASSEANPSGVQGACPEGWHLPSDAEWTILTDYLGGEEVGGKMKEAGITHWRDPNTGADNSSGFTALPGGYRGNDGGFNDIGRNGTWWSSTQYRTDYARPRGLNYSRTYVDWSDNSKEHGFSVRCLRDKD